MDCLVAKVTQYDSSFSTKYFLLFECQEFGVVLFKEFKETKTILNFLKTQSNFLRKFFEPDNSCSPALLLPMLLDIALAFWLSKQQNLISMWQH